MTKASIFIANFNKNDVLPNVLVSLSRQETSFPIELCFVDDCSDEDPLPLIENYLPNMELKYKRLNERIGTRKSMCECINLMSPESDIIICQSSDVMYGGPSLIQELCSNVKPGTLVMPEVRNITIPKDLYLDFNVDKYLTNAAIMIENSRRGNDFVFYAGPRQPAPGRRWYMFLAAISKEDLLKTCFPYNCFDKDVSDSMHSLGFTCVYLPPVPDLVGIHQRHGRTGPFRDKDGLYDK